MGIFHEFPYGNMHDQNLDWILKVVKDFLDKYQNVENLIQQAVDAINESKTEALEEIGTSLTAALNDIITSQASALTAIGDSKDNALSSIATALGNATDAISTLSNTVQTEITTLKNTSISEITTAQGTAISAITTSQNNATAIIEQLYNTLPASAQDILGRLNILDNIITGYTPSNAFQWLQGGYVYPEGVTPPTPPAIDTDDPAYDKIVSSLYMTGCAGQRLRISTDGTIHINLICCWFNTPPGGAPGGFSIGQEGLTPTFGDIIFPLNTTAFSIELKSPDGTVSITPNDVIGHIDVRWVTDFVDQATVAPKENSNTANIARETGELFFLDGVLYKALDDIAVGDTIVTSGAGANCQETSISGEIKETNGELSELKSALTSFEEWVTNTEPNPNKAVFSNSNFNGTATTLTYENDGFVYTHGSSNDANWFKWESLEVGTEYTLKFKLGNVTTSSGTKIFVSSLVDEIYSEGYAISSIISAPTQGEYTLTFIPTLAKVGFMFRVGYSVSTFTITDVVCKKTTDITYIDLDKMPEIPLDKIGWSEASNPSLYTGVEFLTFTKCLCIGDSLTEGVFNTNSGGSLNFVTIPKYSYPSQMQKIYGIETTNKGDGGQTAQGWYNAHSSDDLSGHDACIIALGANDALQSISKADTKSALNSIVNLVKTANSKIKIFLCTLLPAYYTDDSAHNDTNDAIKEVVEENTNCYLIDLTQYSACAKNSKYAQGHLTALGYMQEARELVAMASYIIKHSEKNEFRYIQFINTNYSYS